MKGKQITVLNNASENEAEFIIIMFLLATLVLNGLLSSSSKNRALILRPQESDVSMY